MHSHVDVFDFSSNTWVEKFDTPKDMAHSHLGVATDGRYIYVVSGQYGPQCRGPINRAYVLDTVTKKWDSLPPLPFPRCVCQCFAYCCLSHCICWFLLSKTLNCMLLLPDIVINITSVLLKQTRMKYSSRMSTKKE